MRTHLLVLTSLSLVATTGCPAGGNDDPLPTPDFVGDADLNLYLFGHFDAEEPLEMQQGVEALEEQLSEIDLTGDQAGRRWNDGEFLTEEHWGGASYWADAQPLDQVIVSVAGHSAFGPDDHASLIPIEDQTPFESSSSAAYNREVTGDSDCFVAGTCDRVTTMNEVHRSNAIVNIWYDTPKVFRWVELSDGRNALVARAWLEMPFEGQSGNNRLEQFTALEVRIPDPDGGAVLYTTIWGDLKPPLGDAIVQNITANGIDEGWEKTDDYLSNQ